MTIYPTEALDTNDRYIRMKARHDGICAECEDDIGEDQPIIWDTKEFKAYHEECGEDLL